jgi:hypothetical protein
MEREVSTSVDAWVERLNAFYAAQFRAFDEGRLTPEQTPVWSAIVGYQAPLPGSRLNQQSVVYARPTDALGNPSLPPPSLVETLRDQGVDRVVVGHTPSGDSPSILRENGFELILADNSYGRIEPGSQVLIDDARTSVNAHARLDDGVDERVKFSIDLAASGPIGARDLDSGQLVKGMLASGDYLMFRWSEPLKVEQLRASEAEISRRRLGVPW